MKSLLKGWNKKWVWSPNCLTAYYHSVYDKHAKLDAFASDTIYGHFICTLKTHISCGENNVSKKVVIFLSFFLSPWNNKSKLTSRGKLHHKSGYLALIEPKKKKKRRKGRKNNQQYFKRFIHKKLLFKVWVFRNILRWRGTPPCWDVPLIKIICYMCPPPRNCLES